MIDNKEALEKLLRIKLAIEEGGLDQPVDIAAWKCRTELIDRTPKRFTGQTRNHWQVERSGQGQRLVVNRSKIMLFLERGTGQTTGGYIYPKSKKFLFVALTSRAIAGWHSGLQRGTDYVLARRVRAIKAMHIVEKFRTRASEILREEVKAFLERIIR